VQGSVMVELLQPVLGEQGQVRLVVDPADVLAVEWVSRDTEGDGQYL
jgi:hypothetical protein